MDSEYFVSINNVSRELGIPAYTLRYWEKQFPTIVHPTTGAGGRRYYRTEMVERLRAIQDLLYNRGMTIAGVKKLIRSGEFGAQVSEPVVKPRVTKPTSVKQSYEPAPNVNDTVDIETVFGAVPRPTQMSPIDGAKLDLALGLLGQAKDLLQ